MPAAAAIASHSSSSFRRTSNSLASVFLLIGCLAVPAAAQTAPQTPQNPAPAPQTNAQTPAPAQQKPAPVTTTVIVHGEVEDNYLPESVTVGTLGGEPLERGAALGLPSSRAICSATRSRACSPT